jgi:hypothetical protein
MTFYIKTLLTDKKMKNIILGASNVEDINYVKNWILSAKQFKDNFDIILLVYKYDKNVINNNKELFNGVELVYISNTAYLEPITEVNYNTGLSNRENSKNLIHHLRFFHYWQLLNEYEKDVKLKDINVIITDVKDVIFNNLDFANNKLNEVLVADECITFENEDWNKNNVLRNFGPYIYNELANKSVGCCGVIAGNAIDIMNLSLMIYNLASGKYVADQSGLNVLMYLSNLNYNFKLTKDFFQVHSRLLLSEKSTAPLTNIDEIMKHSIIHQYERYNELNKLIEHKVKELI